MPVALIVGGIITVVSGFFVWSSLDKVYKIIDDTPTGKLMPVAVAIGALAGLLAIMKGLKSR